jgi:hypothetical protein
MKKLLNLSILIILLSFSCKDEYEQANESIKGVWKLESVQYLDSLGNEKVFQNSNIKIVFLNDQTATMTNDSAFEIINNDTTFFHYFVSPAACCFYFDELYYENRLLYALGTMCYDLLKIDKNTIEFFTENDYVAKQKIYKVTHLYTKIE